MKNYCERRDLKKKNGLFFKKKNMNMINYNNDLVYFYGKIMLDFYKN